MIDMRRQNADTFRALFGGLVDVALQAETGQSSWFGFALLLQGKLAGCRSELVARLTEAGIECRPIVAGNFVANSVIRHLDHSIGSALTVAEDVDANGLFLGNHHYPIVREMEMARGVVAGLAAAQVHRIGMP